jgi:hypothetical protein
MTRVTAARSDEAGKSSRAPMFILGAIGVVVVLVVAVSIAIVASVGDIGSKHLKPIPVPASACPYLHEVHDKADVAARTYWDVLTGQTDPRGWRTKAAQHAQQLAAFELTLLAAVPHVPAAIATELKTVRVKVAAGREEVAAARSASEYVRRSSGQAFDGTVALGNASDLVGNACGFTLSPSSYAFGG